MNRYLGNNHWMINNKVLNTKTKMLIDIKDLPSTMKWKKSFQQYRVEEGSDFKNMRSGSKFILFDFCEDIERRKATVYCSFSRFKTIDMTNRKFKYEWIKFNNNFIVGNAYMMLCEINHDYPDSLNILKTKKL